jgi:hypothetical protein
MKRMGYARVALAAAVGSGLLITWPAHAGSTPTRTTTCDIPIGGDPDTVSLTGSPALWPPNHKMADYVLTAKETDGEKSENPQPNVTLAYRVTGADALGGDGGPIHDADAKPAMANGSGPYQVVLPFQLRAERSGQGSGRTYTIKWNATFDNGLHMCNGAFTVTVPHDQGH